MSTSDDDDEVPTLHSFERPKLAEPIRTPTDAPAVLGAEPPVGTARLPAPAHDTDVEDKTKPTTVQPSALLVDDEVDLQTRQVFLPPSKPRVALRITAPMGFAAGLVVGAIVAVVALNLIHPPPGRLSVVTDRSTTLRIGDEIYGYGPIRNVEVAAGKHELTLIEPSGATRHLPVEVESGETLNLKLNIDSLPR